MIKRAMEQIEQELRVVARIQEQRAHGSFAGDAPAPRAEVTFAARVARYVTQKKLNDKLWTSTELAELLKTCATFGVPPT